MAAGHLGQDLASDNAVHHTISEVGENIKNAADFAGVVSHEIARNDLSDGLAYTADALCSRD
jgi:hypothetical protein